MARQPHRLAGRDGGVRRAQPGDEVSFADSMPLLLVSLASLEALNRRLDRPVPMGRFRPNLVVEGVDAHAEDTWKQVSIGDVVRASETDFRLVECFDAATNACTLAPWSCSVLTASCAPPPNCCCKM